MGRLSPERIAAMAPEERLALIDALWDSLDGADIPVPQAQRDELDRRMHAEAASVPWEQVRGDLYKTDG